MNARSKITTIAGRGLYDGGGAAPAAPAAPSPAEEGAFKKVQAETNADARLTLLLDFEKQFPDSRHLTDIYQDMIKVYQEKHDQGRRRRYATNWRP